MIITNQRLQSAAFSKKDLVIPTQQELSPIPYPLARISPDYAYTYIHVYIYNILYIQDIPSIDSS